MATSEEEPKATAAPLSLSSVRDRYPNLFREYTRLSDREQYTHDDIGDLPGVGPPPIDAATGLLTTIMHVDFMAPLSENPPGMSRMTTTSDANRFCMFVWKMMNACESGSVGGDACRQFEVLNAALDDALAQTLNQLSKFDHLLGWTTAAAHHGLHALLYRGDPERNRSLFKVAADAWKKLFEEIGPASDGNAVAVAATATATTGVDDAYRKFAVFMCESFGKILRSARKEYGDHARYTFNFIKRPRAPKAVASSVPAAATAAAASSFAVAAASAGGNQKENSAPPQENIDDDEPEPWELEGWVPTTKGGKQKTPNVIRGELQRYIDQCKADGSKTQTSIINQMGVNNNTFRRFMNPKTYKNPWSAVENGTYWAAAKLLEEVKRDNAKAKKSGAKRKPASVEDGTTTKKAKGLSKKMSKAEASSFLDRINSVTLPPGTCEGTFLRTDIYDSCPQLVAKIKAFLQRDGITKAALCVAMGNINNNSMNRFLASKGQDQCANVTYKAGYAFFEKLRILEGKEKTAARVRNEEEKPDGFSVQKASKWVWSCAF